MEDGLVEINFRVNGHSEKLEVDPRVTLQDAIRDRLDLTGTKKAVIAVLAALVLSISTEDESSLA